MTETIGEFLVRTGVMHEYQVKDVLTVQRNGDRRIFGEIAIAFGYITDVVLHKYVEAKAASQLFRQL
jgi:hypothetical protein